MTYGIQLTLTYKGFDMKKFTNMFSMYVQLYHKRRISVVGVRIIYYEDRRTSLKYDVFCRWSVPPCGLDAFPSRKSDGVISMMGLPEIFERRLQDIRCSKSGMSL